MNSHLPSVIFPTNMLNEIGLGVKLIVKQLKLRKTKNITRQQIHFFQACLIKSLMIAYMSEWNKDEGEEKPAILLGFPSALVDNKYLFRAAKMAHLNVKQFSEIISTTSPCKIQMIPGNVMVTHYSAFTQSYQTRSISDWFFRLFKICYILLGVLLMTFIAFPK